MPGTNANLDHVVIASTGVWVIDMKRSRARTVSVGAQPPHLWAGCQDRTRLLEAMARQVAAVRRRLGAAARDVAVRPALRFVGPAVASVEALGALVIHPDHLIWALAKPGPLAPVRIDALAERLIACRPSR